MNMLTALILHGRVVTTLAKAKEYRRHADKIVTLAKVKTPGKLARNWTVSAPRSSSSSSASGVSLASV